MSRARDEGIESVLDDLYAYAEDVQLRARAALDRPVRVEEPAVLLQVEPEPERAWTPEPLPSRPAEPLFEEPPADLDAVLGIAADAAAATRGADAALVRIFGDTWACAARGMSVAEADRYGVGPPPAGPRVWALAIAYEPDATLAGGLPPIGTALAAPIVCAGETIGFVSVFSRSPDVVFDEDQGRHLQEIGLWVREWLDELAEPAELPELEPEAEPEPAPAPAAPAASPRLRTALLLVAGAACVVAPALMATGVHSALRVAAALTLLSLAPGAAAVPLFGSRSAPLELGLVVGTSLGVSALVAEGTLWVGAWSPAWATTLLAAASLVSILVQLALRAARPRPVLGAS